jgi:hypothetical protein
MKTQCTEPMEYSKGCVNGKFMAASTYIKNTERTQVNDLRLHPKFLEKYEQAQIYRRRT